MSEGDWNPPGIDSGPPGHIPVTDGTGNILDWVPEDFEGVPDSCGGAFLIIAFLAAFVYLLFLPLVAIFKGVKSWKKKDYGWAVAWFAAPIIYTLAVSIQYFAKSGPNSLPHQNVSVIAFLVWIGLLCLAIPLTLVLSVKMFLDINEGLKRLFS